MMELEAWKLAVAALSLGGAWGGAKAALNGTRDRVKKLEVRADDHDEKLAKMAQSLVRIETKQDVMIDTLRGKWVEKE